MKGFKKTLCVVLALVMMLGLCTVGALATVSGDLTLTLKIGTDTIKKSDGYTVTATYGDSDTSITVTAPSDDADTDYKISVASLEAGKYTFKISATKSGKTYAGTTAEQTVADDVNSLTATVTLTDVDAVSGGSKEMTSSGDIEGYIDPTVVKATLPTVALNYTVDPQGVAYATSSTTYRGDTARITKGDTVLFKNVASEAIPAVDASIESYSITVSNAKVTEDLEFTLDDTVKAWSDDETLTYKEAVEAAEGVSAVTAGWYKASTTGGSPDLGSTTITIKSSGTAVTPTGGDTITISAKVAEIAKGATYYSNTSDKMTVTNKGTGKLLVTMAAKVSQTDKVSLVDAASKLTGDDPSLFLTINDGTTDKVLASGANTIATDKELAGHPISDYDLTYNSSATSAATRYTATLKDDVEAKTLSFTMSGKANTEGLWGSVTQLPKVEITWTIAAEGAEEESTTPSIKNGVTVGSNGNGSVSAASYTADVVVTFNKGDADTGITKVEWRSGDSGDWKDWTQDANGSALGRSDRALADNSGTDPKLTISKDYIGNNSYLAAGATKQFRVTFDDDDTSPTKIIISVSRTSA